MQVYYCKIFRDDALQHFEWRRIFQWIYADTLSDCPSNIYTGVSEDDRSSEYSSDSDDGSIRPPKRQKTLVIDSDMGSQNETHLTGEDFTGVSGVTIKCDNWQTISEVTELIFDWPKYKLPATGVKFAKIPWSVMS